MTGFDKNVIHIEDSIRYKIRRSDDMISRKYVEDVLLKMGIPANIKGFKYITDAVMLLDEKEWRNPKYTALYYTIGKINGSTATRTERAIRHAFSVARSCKGDYELVEHYIGFINCENSSSIASLYRTIKYESDHSDETPLPDPERKCGLDLREEEKEVEYRISQSMLRELIHQELAKTVLSFSEKLQENRTFTP